MSNLEMINNSLAELEKELAKIKTVKELMSTVQASAELTINEAKNAVLNFKETAEKIISESRRATDKTISETKELQDITSELVKSVNELVRKLDRVDFPTRLDKLDTSISNTQAAIQNIFQRFDSIERNIKEDIRAYLNTKFSESNKLVTDHFTKEIKLLDTNISKMLGEQTTAIAKKFKLQLITLICLGLLSVGNLVILVKFLF